MNPFDPDSPSRLRPILDHIPWGVVLHDEAGQILDANETAIAMSGLSREAVVGKRLFGLAGLVPPDDLEGECRRMLAGDLIRREGEVSRPGGTGFAADVTTRCFDEGGARLFVTTVGEVSRWRLEYDRLAAERGVILEMANDMIYRHDTKGVFTYVSPAIEKISGYSPKEWEQHYTTYLTDNPINQKVIEYTEETLRTGEQHPPYPVEIRHRDGHPVLCEVSERPYFEDGVVAGIVGIARDITETERARAAEREAVRNYQMLFLMSQDAIVLHTLDPREKKYGKFVDMNPAAQKMFGYALAELRKLTPLDVSVEYQPDGRHKAEGTAENILELLKAGTASFERLCRRKNGEEFLAHVVLSLHEDNLVHATLRDITDRKRIEEERLKSQKLESMGILAGGIAHDLNNLLSIVTAGVAVLKAIQDGEGEGKEVFLDIESAVLQAKGITGQLLAFTRGGAPVMEAAPLPDVLEESANLALRGTNVTCSFDWPASLPLARFDRTQIGQVVFNLVLNARQAMPGGGAVTISADPVVGPEAVPGLSGKGAFVKFSVRDEGVGIPREVIGRIFEPYFTTKPKGRGLGLATAYHIVSRHGGLIRVSSEPGKGSIFDVYLPAAEPAMVPAAAASEAAVEHAAASGLARRRRVLIMDDEASFRRSVGRMIERLGYEVGHSGDGAEAIDAYDRAAEAGEPFDAVVMDLTVPGGMGGKRATEILLERHPEAKVIVTSGYSDDPIMAEYRSFGFCGVLRKPFDPRDFTDAMSRIFPDG